MSRREAVGLIIVAAGLILAAFGIAGRFNNVSAAANQADISTRRGAPGKAIQLNKPEELSSVGNSASLHPNSGDSMGTTKDTHMAVMSSQQISPQATDCQNLVSKDIKAYDQAVASAKSDLDSRMAFPAVGATFSSRYVATYNQTVQQLYTKYYQDIKNSGCDYPLSHPTPLSATYPY